MEEPPPRMDAEITHDGATWTALSAPVVVLSSWTGAAMAGGSVIGAGLLLSCATGQPGWFVGGGLLGMLTVVGLGLAAFRRFTVRVGPRAVTVEEGHAVGGAVTRHRFEHASVERVAVLEPSGHKGARLFLKQGEQVLTVGEGQPPEHLEWIRAAIEEAARGHAAREAAEGREYFFHREEGQKALEGVRRPTLEDPQRR